MSFALLLKDKARDITSFSFLSDIKKEYKTNKVGHAGTLDKFASGLMIVLVGGATKLNNIFQQMDKEYIGEIKFGEETDTLDREGVVIKEGKAPTEGDIVKALNKFIGPIKQVPPPYSAIHVNGKRAYKEARRGRKVILDERDCFINQISLLSYDGEKAVIKAMVSKGTYIRALARDIAREAGSVGYLTQLRRTKIGPFDIDNLSLTTEEILDKTNMFSYVTISEKDKIHFLNGNYKSASEVIEKDNKIFSMLFVNDYLFGICEKNINGIIRFISTK